MNLVCPYTKKKLKSKKIGKKKFLVAGLKKYIIYNGIYDFRKKISVKINDTKKFYDLRAQAYEDNLYMTFKTHNVNEIKERKRFIKKLNIKKDSKVLDLACGTGRDSSLIANQLGPKGYLAMQDISSNMLRIGKKKIEKLNIKKNYILSEASRIPYPDKFFDAVYSFGGLGEFENIKESLKEMVRVTKIGGKIVVGDESVAPWLRKTNYFKILKKTNPQFEEDLPMLLMPVEARETNLEWVLGQSFYLIDFKVGNGEPKGNFDFVIPGLRGGTYRTRHEGEIEGVSKKAKERLLTICKKNNISMHEFVSELILNNEK